MLPARIAVRTALEGVEQLGVVAEGAPGTLADIVRYSRPDVLVISHSAESEALHTLLRFVGSDGPGPDGQLHDREGSGRQGRDRRGLGGDRYDLGEPGGLGPRSARPRRPSRTACVVLAEQLTGHGTRQLLRQGAVGILRRGTAARHLPWAVTAAAQGSLALDPGLTEVIRSAYARPTEPNRERAAAEALPSALTPRERDVLVLVGDGLSNRDIAGTLSLSPDTVKGHLRRICAKLGVETRVHAARIAWHAGVGTPHPTADQVPELRARPGARATGSAAR
ncbi:hypothetical protein GCM10023080_009890 [Streptomyces pseudoechinosporeus]